MNHIPKPLKADKKSVTLARKDWNSIIEALEDADDRRSIIDARARRAAGMDDAFPVTVMKRLIAGENPVRVYREWRGMTATALAKAAKVAQPYLSAIETGSKPGSAAALKRIAALLDVDMEELVTSK
ncbi:MAG TPA: helix-turn-helix transcriptional regulator [Rhizomicrobium sp.]|jgi:DNA-binding XRE family transcriptional regulator|nr:helix-turn-helix transcriptional regulator [Rhizomicrobium sp.]